MLCGVKKYLVHTIWCERVSCILCFALRASLGLVGLINILIFYVAFRAVRRELREEGSQDPTAILPAIGSRPESLLNEGDAEAEQRL